jgi:type II secretory pathway pseudopilin PulG
MKRREGGFTVLEVLVAMTVLILGLAGVLAVQTAASKGNQNSRKLDLAKESAEQTMESLRNLTVPTIEGMSGTMDDVHPPRAPGVEGMTFHRSITVTPVTGQPGLVLVTVTVNYAVDGDETDLRGTTLQMLRTRAEPL